MQNGKFMKSFNLGARQRDHWLPCNRIDDVQIIRGMIVHCAALQFPHPDWAIAFDTDQELAIATRAKVFDMTSTDKLAVAGAHLPFPGIGHVVKSSTGYGYVPLFWAPG